MARAWRRHLRRAERVIYLVNGLNANGFTAELAVRDGHQEAQLAYAGDWGAIGRIDYEPVLGKSSTGTWLTLEVSVFPRSRDRRVLTPLR